MDFHFGKATDGSTLVSVSEENELVWPDLDQTSEWFGRLDDCPFECPEPTEFVF